MIDTLVFYWELAKIILPLIIGFSLLAFIPLSVIIYLFATRNDDA